MIKITDKTGTYTDLNFYTFSWKSGEVLVEKIPHQSTVFLWNFKILESFRRRGLSKIFLAELVQFVKENYPGVVKISLLVISSNHVARKVYEKFGFVYFEEVHESCMRMDYKL
jgi:ribosomal protein S18 acetylase RimI-like enzyme